MKAAPQSAIKPPRRVPLSVLAAGSLREAILAANWQGYLPGERELAARLQVSRQTLRSALEELRRDGLVEVSARRRRRILLDGAPASAVPSKVIAVISGVPLLAMRPSIVVMVDELRDRLSQAGFSLEIHVSPASFSARPDRHLESLTSRSPAAAWLLLASLEPMQRWFANSGRPCLVIGSCAEGVELPSVDVDFRAGCRHAGAMLRRKGHRSVAFICLKGQFGGDRESELGLREGLQGDDCALHVIRHDGTPKNLCQVLDTALRSKRPPTACVVARAVHVLTAMMFLLKAGKRIPEDIAVVSRDEEIFLQHTIPAVTRYSPNPSRMARNLFLAVRQIAETGVPPSKPIRLMPQFVRGETV